MVLSYRQESWFEQTWKTMFQRKYILPKQLVFETIILKKH